MTDPKRIAALAEALRLAARSHVKAEQDDWAKRGEAGVIHVCNFMPSGNCAADIASRLPPDWCGHEKLIGDLMAAQRVNDCGHVYGFTEEEHDELVRRSDLLDACEARLRKIEEAARKEMALDHPAMLPGSVDHGSRSYPCRCAVHEDLRAALEADR